jgi:hypothetical protein
MLLNTFLFFWLFLLLIKKKKKKNQTPLKTITDAHDCPVVHIRFLQSRTEMVTADAKGRVKRIALSRVLMMFGYSSSTEKLLDGEAGQIHALSVLLPAAVAHPSDSDGLFAMCTSQKTSIVRMHPNVTVCFKLAKPGNVREGALPYLTWRRPMVQGRNKRSAGRVLDPLLAIAWGCIIQLIQVLKSSDRTGRESRLEFMSVGQFETNAEITGIEWLGEEALVFTNNRDEVRVLDPFSLEELETVDVRSLGLVYHSFSLHPSGTVEPAYHNSFRGHDAVVYLLGLEKVASARILSWSDRITALVDSGEWIEALSLALEFYEGRAKAVAGLPRDVTSLRAITSKRIAALLLSYVDFALPGPGASEGVSDEYYQNIGGVCIDYCQSIKRIDLLFGEIYGRFGAVSKSGLFLELLEPFILNDKLTSLNPAVMQAFVDHYSEKEMLLRVEQCILHMDIASLDFHQVATLCRKYGLYSALIYIFNKGLDDYVTPMEEIVAALQAGDLSEDDLRPIGYKLLLYLSFCFSGRAFPRGTIPGSRLPSLRAEILHFFFDARSGAVNALQGGGHGSGDEADGFGGDGKGGRTDGGDGAAGQDDGARDGFAFSSSLSARENGSAETASEIFPRLKALILFDAREFFTVLSLGICLVHSAQAPLQQQQQMQLLQQQLLAEAPNTPNIPEGSDGIFMSTQRSIAVSGIRPPSPTEMLESLVQLLVDENTDPYAPPLATVFPVEVYQQFYYFVAVQWAQGIFRDVSEDLGRRVIAYLTDPVEIEASVAVATERESLLLTIVERLGPHDQRDPEKVLLRCERVGFFKVAASLYQAAKQHAKVLACFLKDEERHTLVFDYITQVLKDQGTTLDVRESIKAAALEFLPRLVSIDPLATASLVIESFPSEFDRILKALEPYPEPQFRYLRAILLPRDQQYTYTPSDFIASETLKQQELLKKGVQHTQPIKFGPKLAPGQLPKPDGPSIRELMERAAIQVYRFIALPSRIIYDYYDFQFCWIPS